MGLIKLSRATDGDLDHEILGLLLALVDSFKDLFQAAVEAADLTLPLGHLLMSLDEPTPMSELARNMGFDASHITSIVDKLEDRRLVERRPDANDRRVKRIVITPAGQAVRDQIEDQLLASMLPLEGLDADQRVQLRDLLAAATGQVTAEATSS
ncbi:MAG: MarR family winged helix-turn-helix transcriptional regulator [Acidimicrobiales bacterium]